MEMMAKFRAKKKNRLAKKNFLKNVINTNITKLRGVTTIVYVWMNENDRKRQNVKKKKQKRREWTKKKNEQRKLWSKKNTSSSRTRWPRT